LSLFTLLIHKILEGGGSGLDSDAVYNIHEALKILKDHYVTDSLQMVSRWIREGALYGERSTNRKDGWLITQRDLDEFISERMPGMVELIAKHSDYVDQLPVGRTKELDGLKQLEQSFEKKLSIFEENFTEIEAQLKLISDKLQELSQKNDTHPKGESKHETTPNREQPKNLTMSYEVFVDVLSKTLPEGFKEQYQDTLKEWYGFYFESSSKNLKSDFVQGSGEFYCKETKVRMVKFKSFIKNVIKKRLDQRSKN
jgi:hypothetical protein